LSASLAAPRLEREKDVVVAKEMARLAVNQNLGAFINQGTPERSMATYASASGVL